MVDNLPVVWRLDPENPDIGVIDLNIPLLPGQNLELSTPFRLKFPDARFSRLGHHGQAYYATQWYPKPAVYDKNGWNPMPYLNYGEFFSDFGSVDVFLTIPKNYVVASSGLIMNDVENQWLDTLSVKTFEKAILQQLPDRIEFPPSASETKTIHLHQNNVHDFAWFADKRYYVLRARIRMKESGREVLINSFFNSQANRWLKSIDYTAGAIYFMSDQLFEYPWDKMSVAQGVNSAGAGMEYPALTIIGATSTAHDLERIIVHETFHNWFYGIVATNERRHPWLDEGLTTFFETSYMAAKYPDQRFLESFAETSFARFFDVSRIDYIDYLNFWYLFKARKNLDQPINLQSKYFTKDNYFAMPYFKAALSFLHLEGYLGREVFNRAIRQFAKKWAFAHPDPEYFRRVFNESTGKELGWFFNELIATNRKIDYAIIDAKPNDLEIFEIRIANKGQIAAPFSLSGLKKGKVLQTIWYDGFEGSKAVSFPGGNYDLLQIDHARIMPTINRRNDNFWPERKFPKFEPVRLQFLGSVENAEKTQVFFAPVVGYNQNNGLMAGVALFNSVFPARSFEVFLMPLYSPFTNRFSGSAWFYKSLFLTKGAFQHLKFGVNFKRYGHTPGNNAWNYCRYEASLQARLRKPYANSTIDRHFFFRSILVDRNISQVLSGEVQTRRLNYLVNEAGFQYQQNRVLNPWGAGIKLEQGQEYLKVSGLGRWFFYYNSVPKGVSVRVFAGSFLQKALTSSIIDYRFRLGAQRGIHDYTFSNTYLGRSARVGTLWGNQVFETDGGLKFPTSVGQTWDWLAAINIKADLPMLPLKVYFDAGTYAGAANAFEGSKAFSWVIGLQLSPLKDIFEINFPLAVSTDISQVAAFALDNYWQRITFSVYLDQLNPMRYLREMRFRKPDFF